MEILETKEQIVRYNDNNQFRLDVLEESLGCSVYTSIMNYTNNPIKIVDHLNNEILVQPEIYYPSPIVRNYVVVIHWHKFPEYTNVNQSKVVKQTMAYASNEFLHKSVYDPTSNRVICHQHAKNVKHPYSNNVSQDYLDNIQDEILSVFQQPPYNVVVNDPDCAIENLYCVINGNVCSIDVSHHTHEPARVEIYSTIPSDSRQYFVERLDIMELRKGECKFALKDGKYLFLGMNKTKVENMYLAYISKLTVNKDIQELQKSFEEQITSHKVVHDVELARMKTKHLEEESDLKRKIINLEEENTRHRAIEKSTRDEIIHKHKEFISNNKVKESEYSLWATIGKVAVAVVPTVIAIMTWVSKTSKAFRFLFC